MNPTNAVHPSAGEQNTDDARAARRRAVEILRAVAARRRINADEIKRLQSLIDKQTAEMEDILLRFIGIFNRHIEVESLDYRSMDACVEFMEKHGEIPGVIECVLKIAEADVGATNGKRLIRIMETFTEREDVRDFIRRKLSSCCDSNTETYKETGCYERLVKTASKCKDDHEIRAKLIRLTDKPELAGRTIRALAECADHPEVRNKLLALTRPRPNGETWVAAEAAKSLKDRFEDPEVCERFLDVIENDGEDDRQMMETMAGIMAAWLVNKPEIAGELSRINMGPRFRRSLLENIGQPWFINLIKERMIKPEAVSFILRLIDSEKNREIKSSIGGVITGSILPKYAEMDDVRNFMIKNAKRGGNKIRYESIKNLKPFAKEKEVRKILLKCLSDADPTVCAPAIKSLAPCADEKEIQDAILDRLAHEDGMVRRIVLETIAPYAGEERMRKKLLELLDNPYFRRRSDAAWLLADHTHQGDVRERFLQMLCHHDPEVVRAAVNGLAPHSDEKEIRDAIVARFADDEFISTRAVRDAVKVLAPYIAQNEIRNALIPRLGEEKLKTHETYEMDYEIIKAVEAHSDKKEIRDALIARFEDDKFTLTQTARKAVNILAPYADEREIWTVFIARLGEPSFMTYETGSAIIKAIEAHIDKKEIRDALVARFGDPYCMMREDIVRLLQPYAHEERVQKAFLQYLNDNFSDHGLPKSYANQRKEPMMVCLGIIRALEPYLDEGYILDRLLKQLEHPQPEIRCEVLKALKPYAHHEKVQTEIIDCLDQIPMVACEAVKLLAPYAGAPRITNALIQKLQSPQRTDEELLKKIVTALAPKAGEIEVLGRLLQTWDTHGFSREIVDALMPHIMERHVQNQVSHEFLLKKLNQPDIRSVIIEGLIPGVMKKLTERGVEIEKKPWSKLNVEQKGMCLFIAQTFIDRTTPADVVLATAVFFSKKHHERLGEFIPVSLVPEDLVRKMRRTSWACAYGASMGYENSPLHGGEPPPRWENHSTTGTDPLQRLIADA